MNLKAITLVEGNPGRRTWWHSDINPLSNQKKRRFIEAPNKPLRVIQLRLIAALRKLDVDLSQAAGGKPGSSSALHVLRHRHNRHIYHLDLHSAYASVDLDRLAQILVWLDPELIFFEAREFLEEYSASEELGGIATGFNACPDLFNIYMSVLLGNRLAPLIEKYELTFSYYLDDLLFSSNSPLGKVKRKRIRKIVDDVGFALSYRKCRLYDRKTRPVVINGVGLAPNGRLFVPHSHQKKFRRAAYAYLEGSSEVTFAVVAGLYGYFRYLRNIDGRRGFWPTNAELKNVELFGLAQEKYRREKI